MHMKGWHIIISHMDSVASKIYQVSFLSCFHALAYIWLHITYPIVFLYFLPYIFVAKTPRRSLLHLFKSLLTRKESTALISYGNKSIISSPNVIQFFYFHFEFKAFLMCIGWFNLVVPSTIQCLSAAVVCSLAFKNSN